MIEYRFKCSRSGALGRGDRSRAKRPPLYDRRERRRNKVEGKYYYEEKSRVGDWEFYTIVGSQRKGALVSMVERGSKFVRLALVQEARSDVVANVIETCLSKDIDKVLTLTMDKRS